MHALYILYLNFVVVGLTNLIYKKYLPCNLTGKASPCGQARQIAKWHIQSEKVWVYFKIQINVGANS